MNRLEEMLSMMPPEMQEKFNKIPMNSFQYKLEALVAEHFPESPMDLSKMLFNLLNIVASLCIASSKDPEELLEASFRLFLEMNKDRLDGIKKKAEEPLHKGDKDA